MSDAPLNIELKTTPASPLRFLSMTGGEELSRGFEYSVVALAKPGETVNFDDHLGKPAQVKVGAQGATARYYHGLITAMAFDGTVGSYLAYRLTLRPWLWMLSRGARLRIFQKKKVPEILNTVFSAYQGTVDDQIGTGLRKREYCVQYRESDFNFVSRLMEEEGIFYFFRHEEGKHTLVLGKTPQVHVAMGGLSALEYRDDSEADFHKAQVSKWRWSQEVRSGKFTVRDHSFFAPTQTYEKFEAAQSSHAGGDIEVYDYPAGLAPYPDEGAVGELGSEAAVIAKLRLEELQSRRAVAHGETSSLQVAAGARLSLQKHPVSSQNAEYIVHSIKVNMRLSGYEAGKSDESTHRCGFGVFKAQDPFRPERITPRPRVGGPQTATVVGPGSDELHVDKHGRVKLRFHWDRETTTKGESSCYVRVAQPSAGKGWGMVFLPRVGQEVVVDFLEGNPDQPIVTGRVYNADNMPPYPLPDKATVSTIKSRSSKGGAATDFNELRFEDLKGSEYLLMQSQKDKLEFVKETLRTEIGKDQHHIVKKDRKEKVEGEFHLTVVKDLKQKVDGKYSLKSAQDMSLATDAQFSVKGAMDVTNEAGTAFSIKSGTDVHIKAGTNAGLEGGMNVHIKGGMNVVIEGGMQLTIKGGSGSVVLGPDGVSITGPLVKINSGGSPGSGSGISPVAPKKPDAPSDPDPPKDPLSHS